MPHHTPAGGAVEDCQDTQHLKRIKCETCLKEVPASAAQSVEATGYVHFFCGLDCLHEWREQNKTNL